MKRLPYLRSKVRRGRWFHTYRRRDKEFSLGVHGLHPADPRVLAAWAAEHARWQEAPPDKPIPASNSFAWGVDLYRASTHWRNLSPETQRNRNAILRRYVKADGDRSLSSISTASIEATLIAKGGNATVNELKALRPIFAHLKGLGIIPRDPTAGIKIERPGTRGFPTASADDIAAFQERWAVGTTERLIFDLALCTGAARVDLARLGRRHVKGSILEFTRHKTGVDSLVPITAELRSVISRTPDIAPTFILTERGRPFTKESLGNRFGDAARAAGIEVRLHGLRKAFCVYWAEQGKSTHQIAAMAGHLTLGEVERYTRAADRRRMIQLLTEGS